MAWTDPDGVQHPSAGDSVTPAIDAHILACAHCQRAFPTHYHTIRSARD